MKLHRYDCTNHIFVVVVASFVCVVRVVVTYNRYINQMGCLHIRVM